MQFTNNPAPLNQAHQMQPSSTLVPNKHLTKQLTNFALATVFSAVAITALSTQANAKNLPKIEKRTLSQPAPSQTKKNDDHTSTEWQLYQKILVLDEEITLLRDKIERMEVALAKSKKAQDQKIAKAGKRLKNQENALIEVVDRIDAANIPPLTAPANDAEDAPENTTAQPETQTTQATPEKSLEKPAPIQNYQKQTDEEQAKKAYLKAYDDFKNQGTTKGVSSMNKFINTYPNSKLVPSAHYWVGEFYLANSKPDLVAAELRFSTVVKRFPKSSKVPKALYRLGSIAKIKKNPSQAKVYMQEIIKKHPNSREVGLARAFLKQLQ